MVEILLFFIGVSLLFYILLGGADYGAGMLESLSLEKNQKAKLVSVINKAMGPVWEANHIWLILIVVILFVGFPGLFIKLMTIFHYPMLALLVGVVFRGCAFTFRHYDAVVDEKTQRIYSLFFIISSFWTTFWLGVIGASLTRGLISTNESSAYDLYVKPWFGVYPTAMGIFLIGIFMYLAASFLIGETNDHFLKQYLIKRSKQLNLFVVFSSLFVFAASLLDPEPLLKEFLNAPLSLIALLMATACLYFMWKINTQTNAWYIRIVASVQIAVILLSWLYLYSDKPIVSMQGNFSFYDYAAPKETLEQLVIALVVGSLLIFPALFFLMRVFQKKRLSI